MCEFNNSCNLKKKYGNFCYKHRAKHLLDDNNKIIYERFTNNSKDYLKKDIVNTLQNNILKKNELKK